MQTSDIIALLFLAAGLPWLAYLAFKRGGVIWGLLVLFFSLFAGLVFCIVKKTGWIPWLMIVAAWSLVIARRSNLI